MRTIPQPHDFAEWRTVTRALLQAAIPPRDVLWQDKAQAGLFAEEPLPCLLSADPPRVPRPFLDLASTAACHRSGRQWPLLYSLLWRITRGERHLLALTTDPDLHPLNAMVKAIRRDIHKMHAFVRFRKVGESKEHGREQFVAWFEPEHHILRLTASFFRKRFGGMDWSILTPDECVHWDGNKIHFTKGVARSQAPDADAQDDLWRTYYRSIFNPARLKVKAMLSEMPKKYWKNLPEADLIDELIADSRARTQTMLASPASPEQPAPRNAYLEHLLRRDEIS